MLAELIHYGSDFLRVQFVFDCSHEQVQEIDLYLASTQPVSDQPVSRVLHEGPALTERPAASTVLVVPDKPRPYGRGSLSAALRMAGNPED